MFLIIIVYLLPPLRHKPWSCTQKISLTIQSSTDWNIWQPAKLEWKIPCFGLTLYCNTVKNRQIATTPSIAISSSVSRRAVEVDIASIASLIVIELILTWELLSEIHLKIKDTRAGDICLVNVKASNPLTSSNSYSGLCISIRAQC